MFFFVCLGCLLSFLCAMFAFRFVRLVCYHRSLKNCSGEEQPPTTCSGLGTGNFLIKKLTDKHKLHCRDRTVMRLLVLDEAGLLR
jgi:hypothetical protein